MDKSSKDSLGYRFWGIKSEFRLKVLYTSACFTLMTAAMVIWRPLKESIFSKVVGPENTPYAKFLSFFLVLIPLITLYSWLVDRLKRHHLLYVFVLGHAIGGIVFYFLLSNPAYGISNTQVSTDRLIGWAFYFFMESFQAFFSTTFWAFADSINSPKDAKYYYGFFVSGSKVGGILSAGLFYLVLSGVLFKNLSNEQLILGALPFGSLFLLLSAVMVYYLIEKVPNKVMHGYRAAYDLEQESSANIPVGKAPQKESIFKRCFGGFITIVKTPYVLGIFSLVFFYEFIIVILDYYVRLQVHQSCPSIKGMTAFYALYYCMYNLIGLFVALFGTMPILRLFGVRKALLIFPVICGLLLIVMISFPYAWLLAPCALILRALNYSLNHPTREVLYIPTTKEIKFKAKTWIDAFGTRLSKSSGSLYIAALQQVGQAYALFCGLVTGLGIAFAWSIVSYFLGKRLDRAVESKEVIGKKK